MISSPKELVLEIINLFPMFGTVWDNGEAFGYRDHGYTYHSVMLTFGPISRKLFAQTSPDQLSKFCYLINEGVAQGGELENAISTCFLEHASQLGVRKHIRLYLSEQARCGLR